MPHTGKVVNSDLGIDQPGIGILSISISLQPGIGIGIDGIGIGIDYPGIGIDHRGIGIEDFGIEKNNWVSVLVSVSRIFHGGID